MTRRNSKLNRLLGRNVPAGANENDSRQQSPKRALHHAIPPLVAALAV